MVQHRQIVKPRVEGGFYFRRIAKSGNSRSLSVSAFIPPTWEVVRVKILEASGEAIVLRIEQIK